MTLSKAVRLAAAAMVSVAGLQLVSAVPAGAFASLTITSVVTTGDSSATKSVSAVCPAGRRVVGGGGIVDGDAGAPGQVWITELQPISTAAGDRFQVSAVETDAGFAGIWWLRAVVFCAKALPGLEIVAETNVATSAEYQRHAAKCPRGKQVLGAGGQVNHSAGQVALQAASAATGSALVSVIGYEDDDGYAGAWSLTAYAICSDPVKGLSIVSATSALDSSAAKSALVTCPAGLQVYASLFSINAGSGDVVLEMVTPWLEKSPAPTSTGASRRSLPARRELLRRRLGEIPPSWTAPLTQP
jgi:hypothetical protein